MILHFFILHFFLFYEKVVCEGGKYILHAHGDKRFTATTSNDNAIVRKRKKNTEKDLDEDFLDLIKIGGNTRSGSFRLKFMKSGKFLCLKNKKKRRAELCDENEKSSLLTWDLVKDGDFHRLKMNEKCIQRTIKIFASRKLKLTKCGDNKRQKWTFLNLNPKRKIGIKLDNQPKFNQPSKKIKKSKQKKESSSSSSDFISQKKPTVPDSVLKKLPGKRPGPKVPVKPEISRQNLESTSPFTPPATEDSSSNEIERMRPAPPNQIPIAENPDRSQWELDKELSLEYHPPDVPANTGKLIQKLPIGAISPRSGTENDINQIIIEEPSKHSKKNKKNKKAFNKKLIKKLEKEALKEDDKPPFNPTSTVPRALYSDSDNSVYPELDKTKRFGCENIDTKKKFHQNTIDDFEKTPDFV